MHKLNFFMNELNYNEALTDLEIVKVLNQMGEYLKEIEITDEVMKFFKDENAFDFIESDVYEILIQKDWTIFLEYFDDLPKDARIIFTKKLLAIDYLEVFSNHPKAIIIYLVEKAMLGDKEFKKMLDEALSMGVELSKIKLALTMQMSKLDECTHGNEMANLEKTMDLVDSYQEEDGDDDDDDAHYESYDDELIETENLELVTAQTEYEQYMREWN